MRFQAPFDSSFLGAHREPCRFLVILYALYITLAKASVRPLAGVPSFSFLTALTHFSVWQLPGEILNARNVNSALYDP